MTHDDDYHRWGTINLNDPHCQQFVEAIASILTYRAEVTSFLARLFTLAPDHDEHWREPRERITLGTYR